MASPSMESIRVRQRVGADGILYLEIPVGLMGREVDVMVIYQPAQVLMTVKASLAQQLYGICSDAPTSIHEQGVSEALDDVIWQERLITVSGSTTERST